MSEKTSPEHRRRLASFAQRDPSEKLDRMVAEITLGMPKWLSVNIETAVDAEQWDRLAAQIDEIRRAGRIVTTEGV
jgi:hypothetical protein